jgi:hypothetical protein
MPTSRSSFMLGSTAPSFTIATSVPPQPVLPTVPDVLEDPAQAAAAWHPASNVPSVSTAVRRAAAAAAAAAARCTMRRLLVLLVHLIAQLIAPPSRDRRQGAAGRDRGGALHVHPPAAALQQCAQGRQPTNRERRRRAPPRARARAIHIRRRLAIPLRMAMAPQNECQPSKPTLCGCCGLRRGAWSRALRGAPEGSHGPPEA